MNTQISTMLNSALAAEYLQLSVSTLAKMRLKGTGPAYAKLGRRVVYRLQDLDVWVAEHCHNSTSEYQTRQV